MALLGIQSPDPVEGLVYACGGTLLNSRYVLIAAHCVGAPPLPPAYKVTTVRLGEFDQSKAQDCDGARSAPPVQNIDVDHIISHVAYSLTTHEHDIALIRLAKPAELNPYVTPICLPTHDFVRMTMKPAMTGGRLTVAGWGRTRFDKEDGSNILQEVDVPIASRTKCNAYFRDLFGSIKDGRFCSGGESNRDSCKGDSGGPIMGRIAVRPGGRGGDVGGTPTRMIQVGIVSVGRGESECSMAGEGHLTLYTKVAQYLPWILDNIKP